MSLELGRELRAERQPYEKSRSIDQESAEEASEARGSRITDAVEIERIGSAERFDLK